MTKLLAGLKTWFANKQWTFVFFILANPRSHKKYSNRMFALDFFWNGQQEKKKKMTVDHLFEDNTTEKT